MYRGLRKSIDCRGSGGGYYIRGDFFWNVVRLKQHGLPRVHSQPSPSWPTAQSPHATMLPMHTYANQFAMMLP
jgi:hypothetical protein